MNYQQFAKKIWLDYLKNRSLKYSFGVLAVLLTNLMQILAPKNIGWIVDCFANKPLPTILTGKDTYHTFIILFVVLLMFFVFYGGLHLDDKLITLAPN